VLPLYIDWTAFFGLRSDGAILLVPTEEPDESPTVEQEERLVNLALYQLDASGGSLFRIMTGPAMRS
jgi:hypothetical protein